MLFKKKRVEVPEQPKITQTIQERMDEVYNLAYSRVFERDGLWESRH